MFAMCYQCPLILLSACSKRVASCNLLNNFPAGGGFFCTIYASRHVCSVGMDFWISQFHPIICMWRHWILFLSDCAEYFFFLLKITFISCPCSTIVALQIAIAKDQSQSLIILLLACVYIKCKRVFKMIPLWLLAAASLSALRLIGMHNA